MRVLNLGTGVGVVASTYEPIEIKFSSFKAPMAGRYKLRFSAYSFWAGPESATKWWKPNRAVISEGRTREPVSVYAETPPRIDVVPSGPSIVNWRSAPNVPMPL